jgi:dTDP-4-dehydrorhamnose 3,5-epimerase
MIFHKTSLKDAYLIELEKRGDDRGFFARTMCREEFAAHGLDTVYVQQNTSFSVHKGTLRGMHYQLPPYTEAKLVQAGPLHQGRARRHHRRPAARLAQLHEA